MRTLKSVNGDLALLPGQQGLIGGLEAVMQRVEQRLLFLLAEWYADARLGTPYEPEIFGRSYRQDLTLQALNSAALSVDEVDALSNVSIDVDGSRVMSYKARISTPYGTGTVAIGESNG